MNCSPGKIMTKIAHKVEVETGTKDGLQLTDTWGFFPPKIIVPSIQVNHVEINLHCWQKGDVLTKKLRSKQCDINLTESLLTSPLLTSPLSLCLLNPLLPLQLFHAAKNCESVLTSVTPAVHHSGCTSDLQCRQSRFCLCLLSSVRAKRWGHRQFQYKATTCILTHLVGLGTIYWTSTGFCNYTFLE